MSNDCGEFSSPVAVMNMMPKMMKPFMTQFSSNFKSALFAFIRPRTPLVYRYNLISWTQSPGNVLVARRCLTVEQFLYWSDWICTGRAAQIEEKTKFRFVNIVLKQWTLSGFVQHTSANSMCKDDNKISQRQKVLHMNAWTCATFSNEF